MENLKNFVKEKKKRKSKTEIHLFLVLQKDNFKQFPDFIRFGDSIGVDSISGTFIAEESYTKNKDVNIEKCKKEDLEQLKKDLRILKRQVRANLEIDEIIEYIDTWEQKKGKNWSKVSCFKPWYSPFIYWDGTLVPCCYCVDNEVVLGDLTKEKFKDVWNGKKMKKFRKMVVNNRIGICSRCEADETGIKNQLKRIPLP
jgi:radical SAM protein with 4Fe4S-binding SPASM domain